LLGGWAHPAWRRDVIVAICAASPTNRVRPCCKVRWVITLEANRGDVARLLAEAAHSLSATADPRQLELELEDPEHEAATDDARQAGRFIIEAAIRRLNGFGKLRWARTFEGVALRNVKYIDSSGGSGLVGFVGTAVEHMLPEDFADMVERLGFPRPDLPEGVDDVNALTLANVTALADTNPDVGRVLHLVELMLVGDDDIDWAAGYSALEVIEHDALRRGTRGQDLGWWTANEHQRFTQMANSVEAVDIRSRHQGRRFNPPRRPLSPKDGSWFIRRVTARWLAWLFEAKPPAET
jgi:hypothetical protein